MPDLSLEILPPRVYFERAATGQCLNFDLRLANRGGESRRLASIAVEIFDANGALVLRRVVDEHGLRPAIETVPDRDVPPGGSLLVFNPVHTFSAGLDLRTVRCTCVLDGETVATEASPAEYNQRTQLYLPLQGRVLLASGHDFISPHRRIDPDHPFAAQLGVRTNSGRFADDYHANGRFGTALDRLQRQSGMALVAAEAMWRDHAVFTARANGLDALADFAQAPLYILFEVGGSDEAAAE